VSSRVIFFFFSSRRRHTRSDRDWSSDVCSSDLDMSAVAAAVTAAVKVPLTQAQFDVLCDFTFNCGVDAFMHSTLLKLLNQGDYAAVPGQLRRWVYSKGQRLPVLAARREREIALWKGESVP